MEKFLDTYMNLTVWQEGHKLVLEGYEATAMFPDVEKFGITQQLRRAVVSITSNIAEAYGRYGQREQTQFFYMALDSLKEVQNQLVIAKDLKFVDQEGFSNLANQTVIVSKLLNGIIRSSKMRRAAP
jgi:four helix bundle protein